MKASASIMPADDEVVNFVRGQGSSTTDEVGERFGISKKEARALMSRLRVAGRLARTSLRIDDEGDHQTNFASEWKAVPKP